MSDGTPTPTARPRSFKSLIEEVSQMYQVGTIRGLAHVVKFGDKFRQTESFDYARGCELIRQIAWIEEQYRARRECQGISEVLKKNLDKALNGTA